MMPSLMLLRDMLSGGGDRDGRHRLLVCLQEWPDPQAIAALEEEDGDSDWEVNACEQCYDCSLCTVENGRTTLQSEHPEAGPEEWLVLCRIHTS